VKSVGQQGVEEGRKKGGLDSVHRLPYRVRDLVGTRRGGVRGLGKGPGDLLRGQGSVILIAREAEERGRRVFGWKKVVERCLRYLGRIGGPWKVRESSWWAAKCEPLGRPDGVWSGRGQEVRPVSFLGRGDGLKVCSPRALYIAQVEGGGVEAGHPCELVVFPSQR